MLSSPIIAFFVQGIPETTMLIFAGLTLNNVKYRFPTILKASLATTITAYFVKQLPLKFNIYPLILIFVVAIFLNLFVKTSPLRSLVISFSIFALQAIIETVLFWYWQNIFQYDYETIITVPAYRIAFGLQVPIFMCILVFIIAFIKKAITKANLSN